MQKNPHPGVIEYDAAQGKRYRVSVSLYKLRPVYGGTYTDLVEACREADRIRFWAHRCGLITRVPALCFPADYSDPEKLPECPAAVTAMADKIAAGRQHEVHTAIGYDTLVGMVVDLQRKVAALEKRGTDSSGPEKLSLVP